MSKLKYGCIIGGLTVALGFAAWEGDLVLNICDQQTRRDNAYTDMTEVCEYNGLSRECREATKEYNSVSGTVGAEISRLEGLSLIHKLVD